MGVDDLGRILFDRATTHVDHPPAFLATKLSSPIELEHHLIRVCVVGRRRRAHGSQSGRADRKQCPGIDGQPKDATGVQLEQFFLWVEPGNERNVPGLVPPLRKVHGQRCLRRSRDTGENDVRFVKRTKIRTVVVAHSKFDRFDAIEIIV